MDGPLPPLQVLEAPRSAQRPAAANTRITYLMRAIRHDLDLTYLDLPAFEALLQGLSCNPPDSVTLKQLQTTADRLEGLQRRLEAYIGPLSEGMDPNSRSIQEEEATLDELIRVNEQINEGIQNFQSFERMRCREEEEESRKALESNSAVANSEAVVGTRTAQPSATQAPWPAASSSLPPPLANTAHAHLAETNNVPRVTIQRTLFQAREILQQFQMLQRDKRKGSAQVINETPTEEFRAAFDRLEGMQKKVLELINEVVSAGIAEEDETVLANLMSVKDELMHCVERYQRAARGDQDCVRFHVHLLNALS
ncbi:unnamed protein product [Schistocephalus solidus]|uniref:GAT domain-containing protein n=1 Tax=Schistocephalus solidus TaxID=70667 RepID=A0A183SP41_SCHSO|nr:unnamed protein product [Schistocephalus solidus]